MDAATIGTILAGLGGASGLTAILRMRSENRKSDGSLATDLNKAAQDWIDFVNQKFEKAEARADEISLRFEKHQEHARVEENRRRAKEFEEAQLRRVHLDWDWKLKSRVESLDPNGAPIPDPPPLEAPPVDLQHHP